MKEPLTRVGTIAIEGIIIGLVARLQYLWPVALMIAAVIELAPWWLNRRAQPQNWRKAIPTLMAAGSTVMLIAILPRVMAQVALVALFIAGRYALTRLKLTGRVELVVALVNQFLAFWAIFVAAAIWHWPRLLILLLVWLVCFVPIRLLLDGRRDPAKTVVAAAWALVAAEVSWVCLNWLVSYVVVGSLVIVPQPAIVLTGLGYCFGSIYLAQREGNLSRRRLSEYVVIAGAILIVVAVGTNWKGTI